MKLYLYAESKNKIGYTPDWLRVRHSGCELTLDIQGEICYDPTTLNCRCKGELVPWVLWRDGEEIDLSSMSEEELAQVLPNETQIICESEEFEVGVYPASEDNDDLAKTDVLSNCEATFEERDITKKFTFTTELTFD